jgi:hypothetical protein
MCLPRGLPGRVSSDVRQRTDVDIGPTEPWASGQAGHPLRRPTTRKSRAMANITNATDGTFEGRVLASDRPVVIFKISGGIR